MQKENIQMTISWNDYILLVKNIKLTDTFSVGETEDCDFILPIEKAVIVNNGYLLDKQITKNNTKINFGNVFITAKTIEEEKLPYSWNFDLSSSVYIGGSMVSHIALLAILAFFMPPLGVTDSDEINKDNLFLMKQYLQASAEREMESKPTEDVAEDKADDREGGTGKRAMGEEGSMGNPNSRNSNKSYGIAGPKDNADVHIARMAALRDASTFGMIGLLNTASGGDPNAPTAPWGRDDSLGNNAISARGNMWGSEIGDAFGAGGLGLSGIGEGGSGKYEGIGLGSIGTIGKGAGLVDREGFGNGHGHLSSGHKVKSPVVRFGTTVATGRLPAEVIQRIVRQNYGRFRVCYEAGLRINPNLQGRVAVRFIIGRDGSVSNVGNGGSDLPDPNVTQCVIKGFYGLSFPAPENGIVSVQYPIMFSSN